MKHNTGSEVGLKLESYIAPVIYTDLDSTTTRNGYKDKNHTESVSPV